MATPKFSNLPLAGRTRTFDNGEARKRVKKWAAPSADDPDKIDEEKYSKAFFWYDSSAGAKDDDGDKLPDNVGDYKLIFADVIDGTLTAIPKAIFQAAAVMQGARGGVNIPDSDRDAVKEHIEMYYDKMSKEFDDDSIVVPWEKANSAHGEIEYRSYQTSTEIQEEGRSKGIASVFEQETRLFGDFYEVIDPTAFDNVLDGDTRVLFNHNPDKILGRTKSGTASIYKSDAGLGYEWDPPDTSYGRDLQVSLKRGDVDQSSFTFTIKREKWENRADGTILRTVLEVGEMFDVSPVTFPAYQGTSVSARSQQEFQAEKQKLINKKDDTRSESTPTSLEHIQRSINLKRKQIEIIQ